MTVSFPTVTILFGRVLVNFNDESLSYPLAPVLLPGPYARIPQEVSCNQCTTSPPVAD